jgi:hypothetical protein
MDSERERMLPLRTLPQWESTRLTPHGSMDCPWNPTDQQRGMRRAAEALQGHSQGLHQTRREGIEAEGQAGKCGECRGEKSVAE